MKQLILLLLFPLLISAQKGFESDASWHTNYEKAIKKAKNKNKNVLVYFTGSDWCTPCKMLQKDLFETKAFSELAENYTLLYIDIPFRDDIISPKQRIYNKKIRDQLNKRNIFPLLQVIDCKGEKIEKISGYSGIDGSLTHYLKFLEKYKK